MDLPAKQSNRTSRVSQIGLTTNYACNCPPNQPHDPPKNIAPSCITFVKMLGPYPKLLRALMRSHIKNKPASLHFPKSTPPKRSYLQRLAYISLNVVSMSALSKIWLIKASRVYRGHQKHHDTATHREYNTHGGKALPQASDGEQLRHYICTAFPTEIVRVSNTR